jgi:hypothetical protein
MFKTNTDSIQFLFSEQAAFWFRSFLSNNDPVCLHLFMIVRVLLLYFELQHPEIYARLFSFVLILYINSLVSV